MGQTSEITAFLNIHKDQLISSGVPQQYWQTLYHKLVNQTFDAGETFQILKLDYEKREEHEPLFALQATKSIEKADPLHIYLIDHAWTYRVDQAKQQLLQHDSLRQRLCNMFDKDSSLAKEELVEELFDSLWKINNYYTISSADNVEDRLPVWYVMDEIGTAVLHSDQPNCRIVPFIYINDQITYSVLFPVEDIAEEDIVYRDFAEGVVDQDRRSALLIPWVPKSFEDKDVTPTIPTEEYFLGGHLKESLPVLSKLPSMEVPHNVLKVFSQYSLVNKHLTNNRFILVNDEQEADILWYTEHFKDFERLSETPEKFVNQFPFEYVITVKDLLCITCRRKESSSQWLPVTYNLLTEVPNFISCFQQREKLGLDNVWIVKPYNLARGLDIHITSNLNYICRLLGTGPKIVQKYITKPVLFYRPECGGRVKFDIRYLLLVKSVKPLEAYVYRHFFLRFANRPFELNEFDVYEKHFTVMNYTDNAVLKHMKCEDFKMEWTGQYPNHDWEDVEKSIIQMLKEILECATMEKPPCGIAESPQSRAVYAADIMLEWDEDGDIRPKILEINFTPDCKRACDYYPDFYNDIFRLLFLNEDSGAFFTL
ncbi:tubulin tyrosine ligase-like 12 isoform X2 [Leptinotarsa decemlineata]|uniref:tubulin tyrosine ligase-like 12 isoform X2 n=1 Tax=Leptinotarsa decemlineata TaxID=7539 RepID=UPI003D306A57